jgi:hypothetical protein
MPTLAVVDGVRIQFYPDDHPPPHFHVEFAEYRAAFSIQTLRIVKGTLPDPKRRAVVDWATPRRSVLLATFVRALSKQRLEPIK